MQCSSVVLVQYSVGVVSTLGGMSRPTEITYKRFASLLGIKKDQHYNIMISLIRCQLCFSLF